MSRPSCLLLVLFLSLMSGLSIGARPQSAQSLQSKRDAKSSPSTAASEGEKRFRTNCSRCHNPPEHLSPRKVRAVIRHMRVRAMLSAEDEKLIREYLAP
jgi:cytochrome c5